MQPSDFDSIARMAGSGQRRQILAGALGRAATRRQGLAAALGAVVGAAAGTGAQRAAAQTSPRPSWTTPGDIPSICAISTVRDLESLAPGSLIAYEELTPDDDQSFPANGRIWRVRYVSTGKDNTERTLVCGIVVAPADPAALAMTEVDGEPAASMVSWTHGTLGITGRCQPSHSPALAIWGPPAFGIGAVGWGPGPREYQGPPEDGILGTMISRGWIVAATDYQDEDSPGAGYEPYVIGKVEAANALDNLRAAHHLLSAVYGAPPAARYETAVWGHSQGGHAALWTGQLSQAYLETTASPGDPRFRLRGVAMEAGASNMLTDSARQDASLMGFGMFDWVANMEAKLTGVPVPIRLAPMFLSFLISAWQRWSGDGAPDPDQMPAYPNTGPLDPSALLTPAGMIAALKMGERCWTDGAAVVEIALPFTDTPYLNPQWSDGEQVGDLRHGNFDATCATTTDPAAIAWCDWFRYQLPGPFGSHDMPKVPMQDGELVPLLITHGAGDEVVRCVTTTPAAGGLPQPQDCVSVRLYESFVPEYCPDGAANGALQLAIWNPQPGVTTADHSDITGLAAAAPDTAPDALRFEGSPLERFLTAAFAGTLAPGCAAAVANDA
jgi:hypothetical protein